MSCEKEEKLHPDPFLISKMRIGLLTDSTQVRSLGSVFSNDSIVKHIDGDAFTGTISDFQIFDTKGSLLLALTPKEDLDSTSTIKTVRVVDSIYKTSKGLNSHSTFKTLKDNYNISNIQNTLNNLIVYVNELNAYFTIDKNELPASLRLKMDVKIREEQIPDQAKIKNFCLQWH